MNKINLYELFNSDTLRNRDTADLIAEKFTKRDKNVIDFKNILFVSRSFANELLSHLKTEKISFEFSNTTHEINKMFEVAETKPVFQIKQIEEKKLITV